MNKYNFEYFLSNVKSVLNCIDIAMHHIPNGNCYHYDYKGDTHVLL